MYTLSLTMSLFSFWIGLRGTTQSVQYGWVYSKWARWSICAYTYMHVYTCGCTLYACIESEASREQSFPTVTSGANNCHHTLQRFGPRTFFRQYNFVCVLRIVLAEESLRTETSQSKKHVPLHWCASSTYTCMGTWDL